MIVLLGTARAPGVHKFVVQYYMTYETGQDMTVTLVANGQEYPGLLQSKKCGFVTNSIKNKIILYH